MKILFVAPRYRPAVGGAEDHLAAVAGFLVERGHVVTVATTTALEIAALWEKGRRQAGAGETTENGVTVHRFAVRPLIGGDLSYRILRRSAHLVQHWPHTADWMASRAPQAPELMAWLEKVDHSFDAVAAFNIAYEGIMGAAARTARRLQRPFIVFPLTHLGAGAAPGEDAVGRFYTMSHQRRLIRSADLLVAQTRTEADFYSQGESGPRRSIVVGPGVDPAAVKGGDGAAARQRWGLTRPVVVTLGTASVDKGTTAVIKAARQLWQEGTLFDLVVAGNQTGDFASWMAKNSGIAAHPHLHLIGPVSDSEKKDLLDAAAMMVLPSRVDSFGIVYLEAWLYGRPVVGANAWGITDVIDHEKNGLLVPFDDPAALARAIGRLLKNRSLAEKLGAAGRDWVLTTHTWEKKLPILEDALVRLRPIRKKGEPR